MILLNQVQFTVQQMLSGSGGGAVGQGGVTGHGHRSVLGSEGSIGTLADRCGRVPAVGKTPALGRVPSVGMAHWGRGQPCGRGHWLGTVCLLLCFPCVCVGVSMAVSLGVAAHHGDVVRVEVQLLPQE